MKILISTGIYPPDIGGPSTYAENLVREWTLDGHKVSVATYKFEKYFPTGIRHLLFFFKVLIKSLGSDMILVLDTWSAAVPTMYATRLLRKKYIIRTGGDFLWESYVQRTGNLVYLKNFYDNRNEWTKKESIIFSLTEKVLQRSKSIIFSTDWQKEIFTEAYGLDERKNFVVENAYEPKGGKKEPENRTYIISSRDLILKNHVNIKEAFELSKKEIKEKGFDPIELDQRQYPHDELIENIRRSYAVIVGSISEISPNMVIDAIMLGTPTLVTKENGLKDRILNKAIFVDPLNVEDIKEKIVWLADPKNRRKQALQIENFPFIHTWRDIAEEILSVWNSL